MDGLRRFLGFRDRGDLPRGDGQESDLRALLRIALPSMVATIAGTVMSFVDFAFVSQLGSEAQAAVGNGSVLVWTLLALGTGIVSAISTFAAQALGRGKPRDGAAYLWQSIYLSLGFGLLSLLLLPLVPAIYTFLGHPPQVQALETVYTEILLISTVPVVLAAAISNYFNGVHRPMVTMTSMIVANAVNVILDYALIFGHFGLPAMGVAGAAWATFIALVLRCAWLFAAMAGPKFRREFQPFAYWRYSAARMWNLLKIGMPVGLQWVADIGTWALFANWLIGKFGTTDLAATHIVWKLLELSWMPAIGIGVGINAVVGKAIGQGDHELAKRRARLGMILCVGYMGVMGTIFALFRYPLVGWFTADESVLGLGVNLMLLAAAFQIFDAMSIAYGSSLRGAGDTKWPAIMLAAYSYGMVIGIGWVLTVAWPDGGSYGPWIMCTIYAILLSLTLRYRWGRGQWKNVDIFATAPQVVGTT
jgi:MATE family multidrug resistance protein